MTQYDLQVLYPQGNLQPTISQLFQDDGSSLAIRGIRALSQRFLMEFFTRRGTVRFAPERGTGFMTALQQGRLQTELDVYVQFSLAEAEAADNLQATELPADPVDERFASATLASLTLRPGTLIMHMQIRSLAGETVTISAPVAVV